MIEVQHLIRKAFLDKLSGWSYQNLTIPVGEEFFTGTPAIFHIGQGAGIKMYGVIQNQTLNDDSPKCNVNQNGSIQLDVNTIFPSNAGNSAHSDLMAQAAYDLLFNTDAKFISFTISGLSVWRAWLEGSRTIVQDDNTNRIFRKICIFSHSIFQT